MKVAPTTELDAREFVRPNGIADWTLANLQRVWVLMVMDYCGGNVSWAALELGVARITLYTWLKQYGYPVGDEKWEAA